MTSFKMVGILALGALALTRYEPATNGALSLEEQLNSRAIELLRDVEIADAAEIGIQECKDILGPDTTKNCIRAKAGKACAEILGRLSISHINGEMQSCRNAYIKVALSR